MKRIILFFMTIAISINLLAQSCQQKEIKTSYTDGIEVFNVCIKNPSISYNENNDYFWYTEFSSIKSTKGGSGGNLLNGNYKFYDIYGNLRLDENYSLGLKDGNSIRWDSLGNISGKTTYSNGDIIYYKHLNEENYWIELDGPLFVIGSYRKVYTKYGTLISEEEVLAGFKQHVRNYYEYPLNQLKEEYTVSGFGGNYRCGKFVSYYDNGKIEIEGQFSKRELTYIQVGIWKWYNRDGTLESNGSFKDKIIYWPNGEMKLAGGLMLDPKTNNWVKIGEWRWYDVNGKFKERKYFNYGEEITK